MKRAKRTSLAVVGLTCIWLTSNLACSLPLGLKNLAETAVPSSPTLPPKIEPTSIKITPTSVETATITPMTTLSPTPTELQITPTNTISVVIPTNTPAPKRLPNVLWDLSHGPRQGAIGVYEPKGAYSALVSLLGENGISILSNYTGLDQVDLSSDAALVISMTSAVEKDFTKVEARHVLEFIQNGGSLLILAETPDFTDRIQPLLDLFNIQVSGTKTPDNIQQLSSHPIFNGVEQVRFLFGGCSFILPSPPAEAIAFYEGEPVIISVETYPGRVLIIGDSNLFDNRGLPYNKQFAINVFRWLTFAE